MSSFYNRPRLLLTLAAASWSGNFILGRAIVGTFPPVTLAFLRWLVAALIFLPFAASALREDADEIVKHWRIIVFLGFMGAGCYNTLSYLGLLSTEALNGLVVNAAGPMFIAVTAWSIFGDKIDTAEMLGLALGFSGVIVVLAKGDLASLAGFRFNSGDLLIIAAIICWSIYTAFLRKRPQISWQSMNLAFYVVAAVSNLPFTVLELSIDHSVTVSWGTVAMILYVAIFPSLLGYIFYNRGVELLGAGRAGLFLFLVPVFGALLAMAFLGERLHLFHLLGFALIIAGVIAGSGRPVFSLAATDRPRE